MTVEPEQLHAGTVGKVFAGALALCAALVAVAWLVVARPGATRPPGAASPLEHGLFDQASGGDDARARGARRLEGTAWVDRDARVVRIPIERAIDAVAADPRLIGAP